MSSVHRAGVVRRPCSSSTTPRWRRGPSASCTPRRARRGRSCWWPRSPTRTTRTRCRARLGSLPRRRDPAPAVGPLPLDRAGPPQPAAARDVPDRRGRARPGAGRAGPPGVLAAVSTSTTRSAGCSRRCTDGPRARHGGPVHLGPRRHAGRAGALVQDELLRGLGPGAAARLGARPASRRTGGRGGVAARRPAHLCELADAPPATPTRSTARASCRRWRRARLGPGARRVPGRGDVAADGDAAARPLQVRALPGRPRPAVRPRRRPRELENLARDVETDLPAEAAARWPDLASLREEVVASQRRRRVTAEALALGEQTPWDWNGGPGITDRPGLLADPGGRPEALDREPRLAGGVGEDVAAVALAGERRADVGVAG